MCKCTTIQEEWFNLSVPMFCYDHWSLLNVSNIRNNGEGALVVNSSPPSAAYMRLWTWSALLQVMALILTYRQLDHKEQTSVKLESKYKAFHPWKCVSKYRLRNGGHLAQEEMS